ncbi:MAG: beta-L-arabinofuranosidase domain-containing protein [Bacteroidales bacterium]
MKNQLLKFNFTSIGANCFKICPVISLFIVFLCQDAFCQTETLHNEYLSPSAVSVKGLLGDEILSSEKGRLSVLPTWNDGQLIKMFSEEYRAKNKTNDWYGEHAGKWLYATSLAVKRSGDAELKNLLLKTADELISYQDKDGYLGSYSPNQRITANNDKFHPTSWDVWNLTYMVMGFLEVNKYFPDERYLATAKNIGELFLKTFGEGKADITNYGTRYGLSATVILESVVELYKATEDQRYIDFGKYVMKRLNEKEGLKMIPMMLAKKDLEMVGDGKIYQNIWNLYAIAKFYELSPDPEYLTALENAWQGIYNNHLNPAGGPWGGIGKHNECFNSKSYFSPYGFVETCSVMSWIHFNKQMLRLTGDAKYAQEVEKAAYNELLAAKYPNGVDWSYHSFANGSRHIAHFNDCCPSSGALALEELSSFVYSLKGKGIACNLYTANEANIELTSAKSVRMVQKTDYPFGGNIQITLFPARTAEFPLFVRIPDWAKTAIVKVNGKPLEDSLVQTGSYCKIDRKWKAKDVVEIQLPYELKLIYKTENSNAPQGGKSIYSIDWFALTQGPLVYSADGLIFGTEREEVVSLPEINPESAFTAIAAKDAAHGKTYQLTVPNRKPILFVPFYRAGDRKEGTWHLTWLQKKIN